MDRIDNSLIEIGTRIKVRTVDNPVYFPGTVNGVYGRGLYDVMFDSGGLKRDVDRYLIKLESEEIPDVLSLNTDYDIMTFMRYRLMTSIDAGEDTNANIEIVLDKIMSLMQERSLAVADFVKQPDFSKIFFTVIEKTMSSTLLLKALKVLNQIVQYTSSDEILLKSNTFILKALQEYGKSSPEIARNGSKALLAVWSGSNGEKRPIPGDGLDGPNLDCLVGIMNEYQERNVDVTSNVLDAINLLCSKLPARKQMSSKAKKDCLSALTRTAKDPNSSRRQQLLLPSLKCVLSLCVDKKTRKLFDRTTFLPLVLSVLDRDGPQDIEVALTCLKLFVLHMRDGVDIGDDWARLSAILVDLLDRFAVDHPAFVRHGLEALLCLSKTDQQRKGLSQNSRLCPLLHRLLLHYHNDPSQVLIRNQCLSLTTELSSSSPDMRRQLERLGICRTFGSILQSIFVERKKLEPLQKKLKKRKKLKLDLKQLKQRMSEAARHADGEDTSTAEMQAAMAELNSRIAACDSDIRDLSQKDEQTVISLFSAITSMAGDHASGLRVAEEVQFDRVFRALEELGLGSSDVASAGLQCALEVCAGISSGTSAPSSSHVDWAFSPKNVEVVRRLSEKHRSHQTAAASAVPESGEWLLKLMESIRAMFGGETDHGEVNSSTSGQPEPLEDPAGRSDISSHVKDQTQTLVAMDFVEAHADDSRKGEADAAVSGKVSEAKEDATGSGQVLSVAPAPVFARPSFVGTPMEELMDSLGRASEAGNLAALATCMRDVSNMSNCAENATELGELGCCDAIVDALKRHSLLGKGAPELFDTAFSSVLSLCRGNSGNVVRFREAGLAKQIQLLEYVCGEGTDSGRCSKGLEFLFVFGPQAVDECGVSASDMCNALLAVMQRPDISQETHAMCQAVMMQLCQAEKAEYRDILGNAAGFVDSVATALDSGDKGAREASVAVLTRLPCVEGAQAVAEKAIPRLVDLLVTVDEQEASSLVQPALTYFMVDSKFATAESMSTLQDHLQRLLAPDAKVERLLPVIVALCCPDDPTPVATASHTTSTTATADKSGREEPAKSDQDPKPSDGRDMSAHEKVVDIGLDCVLTVLELARPETVPVALDALQQLLTANRDCLAKKTNHLAVASGLLGMFRGAVQGVTRPMLSLLSSLLLPNKSKLPKSDAAAAACQDITSMLKAPADWPRVFPVFKALSSVGDTALSKAYLDQFLSAGMGAKTVAVFRSSPPKEQGSMLSDILGFVSQSVSGLSQTFVGALIDADMHKAILPLSRPGTDPATSDTFFSGLMTLLKGASDKGRATMATYLLSNGLCDDLMKRLSSALNTGGRGGSPALDLLDICSYMSGLGADWRSRMIGAGVCDVLVKLANAGLLAGKAVLDFLLGLLRSSGDKKQVLEAVLALIPTMAGTPDTTAYLEAAGVIGLLLSVLRQFWWMDADVLGKALSALSEMRTADKTSHGIKCELIVRLLTEFGKSLRLAIECGYSAIKKIRPEDFSRFGDCGVCSSLAGLLDTGDAKIFEFSLEVILGTLSMNFNGFPRYLMDAGLCVKLMKWLELSFQTLKWAISWIVDFLRKLFSFDFPDCSTLFLDKFKTVGLFDRLVLSIEKGDSETRFWCLDALWRMLTAGLDVARRTIAAILYGLDFERLGQFLKSEAPRVRDLWQRIVDFLQSLFGHRGKARPEEVQRYIVTGEVVGRGSSPSSRSNRNSRSSKCGCCICC